MNSLFSFRPRQCPRIENRPFHADTFVIPAGVSFDGRDTTKADTDAARHRGLQRKMARDIFALGQLGEGFEHGFGAAAEKVLGAGMLI